MSEKGEMKYLKIAEVAANMLQAALLKEEDIRKAIEGTLKESDLIVPDKETK